MPASVIGYTVLELIVVVSLIIGFINEDKIIGFEQKHVNYIKCVKRACNRLNVGSLKFLKILFLAMITPEKEIESLKIRLFPKSKGEK